LWLGVNCAFIRWIAFHSMICSLKGFPVWLGMLLPSLKQNETMAKSVFPLSISRLNELIRAWLGWFVLSAVALRMQWFPSLQVHAPQLRPKNRVARERLLLVVRPENILRGLKPLVVGVAPLIRDQHAPQLRQRPQPQTSPRERVLE